MNREEYEAKKQALLTEVERTFADVELDRAAIESIEGMPSHVLQDEERELLLNLGPRWQEISDHWLEHSDASILIYSNADAFRYYLPAFLSWFLRFMDFHEEGVYLSFLTFNGLLFSLTAYEKRKAFAEEKFKRLTLKQAQTVAQFLVFQCERCVFLYEQEEAEDPTSNSEFWGFKGDYGYKSLYEQFQLALDTYWKQFLRSNFVQVAFPYSAPRKSWRALWKEPAPQKREVYEAQKAALIAEIERAFDGVQREDGTTLHETSVIDNYGSPEERAAARLLDTETRWQDVPPEHIRGTNAIFLDDKGFRYYCPAFLIEALRHFDYEGEDQSYETFSTLDFILNHPFDDGDGVSFAEFFALFSAQQKRAIAHFIEFRHVQLEYDIERLNFSYDPEDLKKEHAEVQSKLDKYWGQFL